MFKKRIFGVSPWLIILVLAVLAAAWVGRSSFTGTGTVPLRTLDEVARSASVTFPPGSRLTFGEWHHSMNSFGYARVELPPGQVTTFLKQPVFGGVISRRSEPAEDLDQINVSRLPHDRPLMERWNLLHVRKAATAGGGELNGGPGSHIPVDAFVGLDHPERPVLFLHWYD